MFIARFDKRKVQHISVSAALKVEKWLAATSCQTITADTSRGNRKDLCVCVVFSWISAHCPKHMKKVGIKNGWVTPCPAERRGSIERNHHHCAITIWLKQYFPVWFSTSFQSPWETHQLKWHFLREEHLANQTSTPFSFYQWTLVWDCVVLVDTMTFSHYEITFLGLPLC